MNRNVRKMNPEIKTAWVKALRSGEYKQVKSQLRTPEGFCCLGVLCNLHAIAHPEIAAKQKDPELYMGFNSLLPLPVVGWAGVEHGWVNLNGRVVCLTELNDAYGLSFKAIANIIEEQL